MRKDRSTANHRAGMLGRALAVVAVLASVLWAAAPAEAAPALGIQVTPNVAVVQAGQTMTWTITITCIDNAEPCTGGVVSMPIPASAPDGVTGNNPSLTTSSPALVASSSIAGGVATWNLNTLPAGQTAQLIFSMDSVNVTTPDGNTYTPTATFRVDNAGTAPVSGSAPITVRSQAGVNLTKTRVGQNNGEPYLITNSATNTDVTYEIRPTQRGYNGGAGTWETGSAALQDLTVTDTLPAGATFVSATGGGTYDAGTGTVTWPTLTQPGANVMPVYRVTVNYSTTNGFTADSDPANPSDEVTNTAQASAHPWLRPDGTELTADASNTHGFNADTGPSGDVGLSKRGTYEYYGQQTDRGADGGGQWFVLFDNSTNRAPIDVRVGDTVPCLWTTGDDTACTAPSVRTDRFRISQLVHPMTIDYVTTTGQSLSYTIDPATATYQGDVTPFITLPGLGNGVWLRSYTLSGKLAAADGGYLQWVGTVDGSVPTTQPADTPFQSPLFPASTPPGAVTIENCLGPLEVSRDGGTTYTELPVEPRRQCGHVVVRQPSPSYYFIKNSTNATQAPGGIVDFTITENNDFTATSDAHPDIYDLLPANLTVVPGSVVVTTSNQGGNGPDTVLDPADAIVTVTDDHEGSGRQLLKVTWPWSDTVRQRPGYNIVVRFKAQVKPGTAVGSYTNTANLIDDTYGLNGAVLGPDVGDVDGDGDTTEQVGTQPAPYQVVQGAGYSVVKSVKGDGDPDFQTYPAAGTVSPNSTATYKVALTNTGNVPITGLTSYDILPYVGDTGSGPATGPRGSEWRPRLTGVTMPAGGVVEYSTSTNPCRGEVLTAGAPRASGPAGCTDDWTATAPGDLTTVRALRFTFPDVTLAPAEVRDIELTMTAPTDANGTAWNSAAITAQRTDNSSWMLPTEGQKVGLQIVDGLEVEKSVAPADGSIVVPGQVLTYTVQFRNTGGGPVAVDHTDHLADVLDDADVVAQPTSSNPALTASTITGEAFTVTGTLPFGETAVVQYQVRVKPLAEQGDHDLVNFVTRTEDEPPGECLPDDPLCTENPVPQIHHEKTSDKGQTVVPGQVVTYTITSTNVGTVDQPNASWYDDLADVLAHGSLVGDPTASVGSTALVGDTLLWSGPLAVGESATVTYRIRIDEDAPDDVTLRNVVVDDSSNCPEAGTDPDCDEDVTPETPTTSSTTTSTIPGSTSTTSTIPGSSSTSTSSTVPTSVSTNDDNPPTVNGNLPRTGSTVIPLVVSGLLFIFLGAAFVRLTKVRRA